MSAFLRLLAPGVLALSLAAALPAAAGAESLRDTIVSELQDQGYTDISVRQTLLGRTRIVAQSDSFYREIVLNPSTGTILRDYWRRKPTATDRPSIFDPRGSSKEREAIGALTSSTGASGASPDDGSDQETEDHSDDSGGDVESHD